MTVDVQLRQLGAVERVLRVFHPHPGEVVELRALRVAGKKAVCETSADLGYLAARAVLLDNLEAQGCYFTLNPLRESVAGWHDSRIKASDVVRRHWLPIDCDSDKSRPKGSNATDEEKQAGERVMTRCRALLESAGLAGAVVGDSGNGWHLCYPIDLPNDEPSQALVKAVLLGLQARYGSGGAGVTPSTHDAPRIWKLYNTMARKGPQTEGRPWRWARLIEGAPWDAAVAAANVGLLLDLLSRWNTEDEMAKAEPREPLSIPERARRYVEAMAPAVSGQGGHDQTFQVAQVLARGFALAPQYSWPILLDYNARCVPPWSEAELRHKIETAEADSRLPKGYLLLDSTRTGPGGASTNQASSGAASAGGTVPPADPTPVTICLIDVVRTPVTWLWPGWLPEGELCILDGDPGLGKSTLTLDLAARLSLGHAMPPMTGQKDLGRGPMATLLLGAEDSLSHTVRPRLDKMGADCKLIHSFEAMCWPDGDERPVILPKDLERMADFITTRRVKLVVVDPLMAYLGSDVDAHKDQDIRRCLRPLKRLAESLSIVVLLVRHLNKLHGGPALYRGGSSIGITGAARASLIVGRDPGDDDVYVLAMNKCNLGPVPTSLTYRVEGDAGACGIVWGGETELRKDQILSHPAGRMREPAGKGGRPAEALDEARRFLADLLSGGAVAANEVQRRSEAAGLSWRTVARAKSELGVRSLRGEGGWRWELPAPSTNNSGTLLEPDADADATDSEPEGCEDNPFL